MGKAGDIMKYDLLQSEDIRRVLQNDNILVLGKKTDIEIKLLIENNAVNYKILSHRYTTKHRNVQEGRRRWKDRFKIFEYSFCSAAPSVGIERSKRGKIYCTFILHFP